MTMTGKIVKGIAGFYYVYTTLGLVECRARGVFRKEEVKPLVGDNVELTLISEEELTGNITRILPPGIARELDPLPEEVARWSELFRMECYLDCDDFLILSGVKRSAPILKAVQKN